MSANEWDLDDVASKFPLQVISQGAWQASFAGEVVIVVSFCVAKLLRYQSRRTAHVRTRTDTALN